mgnify:CR=1 FL=1
MNVLLIGSGGREHALAWALSKSPLLKSLWAAPGNAGIAEVAEIVSIDVTDHAAVIAFCKDQDIGLVVVGPEAPLVAGLVDDLGAAGIRAFGPTAAAARLEGSKAFMKDLCARYGIPTAAYGTFTDAESAKSFVRTEGAPIVVKADGLAAGKGVIIAETVEDAEAAIDDMFSGTFGAAGARVVIEEFMEGEEASFFALCDGRTALPLATAQDHKRAHDGDTGPNTGGMGAYSPAPVMTDDLCQRAMDEIITPTMKAMRAEGTPFSGILYAGLMITDTGPRLLEYNVRFGDPEAQVLMARLKDDLLALILQAVDQTLDTARVHWHPQPALTVVMASRGYPGPYEKGTAISGVGEADGMDSVKVFHAGTARDGDMLKATGGRVLNVTALGRDIREAQARAYAAIDLIDWPEGFCRRDIGWRAIEREEQAG